MVYPTAAELEAIERAAAAAGQRRAVWTREAAVQKAQRAGR